MDTTFVPPKYFRGRNVLAKVGEVCKPIGKKVVFNQR